MIKLIDAHPDDGSICILAKIWQFLALYCLRFQIGLIYSNWKLVYSRHNCVKSPKDCDYRLQALFYAVAVTHRCDLRHPDKKAYAKLQKLIVLLFLEQEEGKSFGKRLIFNL